MFFFPPLDLSLYLSTENVVLVLHQKDSGLVLARQEKPVLVAQEKNVANPEVPLPHPGRRNSVMLAGNNQRMICINGEDRI